MSSILQYLERIKPNHRLLVKTAHEVISNTNPKITFKIAYGLPFYSYYKNLCYINVSKSEVYIGFMNGQKLSNENRKLVYGDRKRVAIYPLRNTKDIISVDFSSVLQEALLLNEYLYARKNE